VIADLGREYALAFNALHMRTHCIESLEHDELFDALESLADEAQEAAGRDLAEARAALVEGAESVRDWQVGAPAGPDGVRGPAYRQMRN
jgi:hypothetical protein